MPGFATVACSLRSTIGLSHATREKTATLFAPRSCPPTSPSASHPPGPASPTWCARKLAPCFLWSLPPPRRLGNSINTPLSPRRLVFGEVRRCVPCGCCCWCPACRFGFVGALLATWLFAVLSLTAEALRLRRAAGSPPPGRPWGRRRFLSTKTGFVQGCLKLPPGRAMGCQVRESCKIPGNDDSFPDSRLGTSPGTPRVKPLRGFPTGFPWYVPFIAESGGRSNIPLAQKQRVLAGWMA